MSIFKSEKPAQEKVEEKQQEKRLDRRRSDCKDISAYYTNKEIRSKIDRLLEKRAKMWAQYEHILDGYDPKSRKAQEKENMKILEEMGVIKEKIRQIDPVFAKEISVDDNR